jgi:hypothetical protein
MYSAGLTGGATGGGYRDQWQPPVCPEPKVFAGQIPFEATTEQVQQLFSQYGVIRSCQVRYGSDACSSYQPLGNARIHRRRVGVVCLA